MRLVSSMLAIVVAASLLTLSHMVWMSMRTVANVEPVIDSRKNPVSTSKVSLRFARPDNFDLLLQLDNPLSYNILEHLRDFTGLSPVELDRRLRRLGKFHFHSEYAFWAPSSRQELAWFYATSVDYLFANAVHPASSACRLLDKQYEPVLDFSGGVGNQVLDLATRGVRCEYIGIGLIEAAFAAYRVRRMGLTSLVTFVPVDHGQDAILTLPKHEYYGAIMAMDVLEHIPHYERVVRAMVVSLKVGGVIIEQTPFGEGPGGDEDLSIHVGAGDVSMAEAMGPCMEKSAEGRWTKIRSIQG